MSLAGKLVGTQMGDKSQRMKPDKRQKRTRRGDVCGPKLEMVHAWSPSE